jgi:hypothetical protein
MVHLPKPRGQFKNLLRDFWVVGFLVFPRQFIHLLFYLLAGHRSSAAFKCLSRYGNITCCIMFRSFSSAGSNVGSILLTSSTAAYKPVAAVWSLQKTIRLFSILQ